MKRGLTSRWFLVLCWACTCPASVFAQAYQELSLRSADGTQLRAWLTHPEGLPAEQARPVVLALHGCGGLYATQGSRRGLPNARHDGMAQLLRAQGYSVLLTDSFSTRGEGSICTQKMAERKIRQTHRRDDVSGALAWLAGQAWVDADKMAVLGWSHGGSAVLAATNAKDPVVSARAVQPSQAIVFYPGCSDALKSAYRPTAPLLMLLGELDDWTPAAPCLELARRIHARAVVYPDSHHDFDNPVGAVKLREDVPNGVHPGRGVHAGRNPVTGPQAWKMVVDTLAQAWASDAPR
ncbi:MAG: dienelactone hydrolase family protein [Betaproteobacteria bacterium]|nr:dienelactone hydrolase family protein [Betaproteobacteria bacterium]